MKKFKNWILLSLGVLMLGLTACEDDDVDGVLVIFPNDLIGEIVSNTIETETFGIVAQIEIATQLADSYIENPETEMSASSVAEYNGEFGGYLYSYDYDAVSMNDSMMFESTASGQYETLLMTSDDQFINSWYMGIE